jgi:hypothetical protein
MTTIAIAFGVGVLLSGVFVGFVAVLAFSDARRGVRVHHGIIGDVVEGYRIVRGHVDAPDTIAAHLSGLPCVRCSTRVITTDAPNRPRGTLFDAVAFAIDDGTGAVAIQSHSPITGLSVLDSGSLARLPDALEDRIARDYGELAVLPPIGARFRVFEEAVLVGEELWATIRSFGRAEAQMQHVVISVGAQPELPELKADYTAARVFGVSALVLVVLGSVFIAWGAVKLNGV